MKNTHKTVLDDFKNICLDEIQGKALPPHPACFRLAERIDKKFNDGNKSTENVLEDKAFNNFIHCNDSVRLPIEQFEPSRLILGEAQQFIYELLENYTRKSYGLPGSVLCFAALARIWAHGPRTSEGMNDCSMFSKFLSGTVTQRCLPYAKLLLNYSGERHNEYFNFEIVEGSRLSSVPKNVNTRRTIAIEPSCNMALQRSLGIYIENALAYAGLDIKTQQVANKELARRGSIDGTLSTVDFKNASDMISMPLVKALFPPEFYELFMAFRSESISVRGSRVRLNMMSTMGNGFTFPMMTLILASLVVAVERVYNGGPRKWLGRNLKHGVFGDDVVISSTMFDAFCKHATEWGFDVNVDKSFSLGPFRESCGGDYYAGLDVTPFYVQELRKVHHIYVAINIVTEWSMRSGVPLPKTVFWLKNLLPKTRRKYIPFWEGSDCGIFSPRYKSEYKILDKKECKKYRTLYFWSKDPKFFEYLDEAFFSLCISGHIRIIKWSRVHKERFIIKFEYTDPLNVKTAYSDTVKTSVTLWDYKPESVLQVRKSRVYDQTRKSVTVVETWYCETIVRRYSVKQLEMWDLTHNS